MDEDGNGADQELCEPCHDAQCTCTGCDETHEDSDQGTYARNGDFYCELCYDEHAFTCQWCDAPCQPLALRHELDNEGLCGDCQDASTCDGCGTLTLAELHAGLCDDCARAAVLEALEAVAAAVRAALDAGATVEQVTVAVGQ